jgi:hypothetical protein
MGSVDREAILHDHAQVIAGANVSDEELEDKLSSFLTLYDGVLEDLMAEKKVLLLERDAFAAHTVPDFTEEVKQRLQQISTRPTNKGSAMKERLFKLCLSLGTLSLLLLGAFVSQTKLAVCASESLEGIHYVLFLKNTSFNRGDIVFIPHHPVRYVGENPFR